MSTRDPYLVALISACLLLNAGCTTDDGDDDNVLVSVFATTGGTISASGEITVTVFDNLTRLPVAGAAVIAANGVSAATNANGVAVINSLATNTPTTLTVGANGFDLTSIVDVNAAQVNLALNPSDPGATLGAATVNGNIGGLLADEAAALSSFELQESFTMDFATGDYSGTTVAGKTFTLAITQLPTGNTQTETLIFENQGQLLNGIVSNFNIISFPGEFLVEPKNLFGGVPGSVTVPSGADNGDLVIAGVGRDPTENRLDVFLGGRRVNGDGFVPIGLEIGNTAVAAGAVAFNLEINDTFGFENLLVVGATTSDLGASLTTERLDIMPVALPTTLVLSQPARALAPVPGTSGGGVAPLVSFDAQGFISATNGFWTVELRDTVNNRRWTLLVNGGTTGVQLPDLSTNATLSALGLTVGNTVEVTITGRRFDAASVFNFNAVDFVSTFLDLTVLDRTTIRYQFTP